MAGPRTGGSGQRLIVASSLWRALLEIMLRPLENTHGEPTRCPGLAPADASGLTSRGLSPALGGALGHYGATTPMVSSMLAYSRWSPETTARAMVGWRAAS